MLTRTRFALGTLVLGALILNHQSTIQSAVRNPQSAMTGWRSLFDGTSLDAWRGYKTEKIPDGWHVAQGTLAKDVPVADIVTKDEFADFELENDWKIGEAGNSGIFYRGTEEYEHIYWSAPEYQLLDDIKASTTRRDSRAPARRTPSCRRRPGISRRSATGTARASS